MLSGIVRINLYPREAHMKASAIPVLPEVASIIVELVFISFFFQQN